MTWFIYKKTVRKHRKIISPHIIRILLPELFPSEFYHPHFVICFFSIRILTSAFLSDYVISHRFILNFLSRTFYPSVEAKCTLGVAVCRFSGVLLILDLILKEDLGL